MESLLKFPLRYARSIAKTRHIITSNNFKFVSTYAPGHFYSPLPDLDEIGTAQKSVSTPQEILRSGIALNDDGQVALLSEFAKFYKEMPLPETKSDGYRTYLDNDYFSFGDSTILYSMLRTFRPKQIIEIGSGFSSALMLDVCERFASEQTKLNFIEPFPDRLNGLLRPSDSTKCTVTVSKIQDVDLERFGELEENDILFVDSSHVAKWHSDLLYIVFNILPILRGGVIIHFHDIPWPFEYPPNWLKAGRAWNEAYFLRAFLQGNRDFEIVYFNSYMAHEHADLVQAAIPLALKLPSFPLTIGNSSLWLRRRAR